MAMDLLNNHLNTVKIPSKQCSKVYKDECVFSFDTPECETGLYVSLTSFLGFSRDYVELYYNKSGNPLFLHIQRQKIEKPPDQKGDGPEKKITRLAIGVEGGFNVDTPKVEYKDTYAVVFLPDFISFPYPNSDLPEVIQQSVNGILEADSAMKVAEIEAMTGTWDGEARKITRHADSLTLLDNGKKILPSGWKCEKCDLTQNLWLNLTDGSILCGRKFYDGSGGNDHAVQHYRETGFPLAVKLGTITKDGKADVYSYDEDDMVEDPNLILHLAHWGINIAQMEKTEKSMVELELDLNQKFGEWVALQEAASQLKPMFGPGYTGLANLGNSCYMNSIMQVVFTIPDFVNRYINDSELIFTSLPSDPAYDFNVQMAKLGNGLMSGKYSQPPPDNSTIENPGIAPLMLKNLIGRGHTEFATKKQQDAQEFFLHLMNMVDRNSRHRANPSDCFKFQVEDRFQCSKSKKVKYTYRTEYSLPLPIPLEAALNKEEVSTYEAKKADLKSKGMESDSLPVVRPRVKLFSCLEAFTQPEIVDQFYSSEINGTTTARKSTRLSSFPDYLLLHLKKFTLREDWIPIKLDVAVEMPDTLDLTPLRGSGLQPGEEPLPELAESPLAPVFDEVMMRNLIEMGFTTESVKRALYTTNNQSVEAAATWIMEHLSSPDIHDPFVVPGTDRGTFVPNEESLASIMAMGFTVQQATKALKQTDNNVERAIDWIFSHQDELDEREEEGATNSSGFRDGQSRYKLVAFVSHMGTSSMVGHYVCHILKDGHWVIFNDNKVALSENPPKDLGYLYLYERM